MTVENSTKAAPAASEIDVDSLYRTAVVVDASAAPVVSDEYLGRLVSSGITALNWTVCEPWGRLPSALDEIAAGLEFIDRNRDRLTLALTVEDIAAAKADGKVAMIFGPQNALPVEGSAAGLRILHQMGVRILQLTYNERNAYGEGIAEPTDAGLSLAGRALVKEMNRLGIVVDLSHCGKQTTLDAIATSQHPVTFTHANCQGVHDSVRNKSEEELRALADKGGVVGMSLWSPMLRHDRRPNLDDFLRQFSYAVDLIGIDHVGVGSDYSDDSPREAWNREFGNNGLYPSVIVPDMGEWYSYDTRFAAGASTVAEFPRVADALAGLGLSENELVAVLGGNFLRVFQQVWGS